MFKSLKQHDRCSDYILDLLEYVETGFLRVNIANRVRIDDIVKTFEAFDQDCRTMPEYCTSRTKEAKDGPGLTDIIELPENPDITSPSTSAGQEPSSSSSPITHGHSHDRSDWGQGAGRPDDLGIMTPRAGAFRAPQGNPTIVSPVATVGAPFLETVQRDQGESPTSIGEHTSHESASSTQKLLKEDIVQRSPPSGGDELLASTSTNQGTVSEQGSPVMGPLGPSQDLSANLQSKPLRERLRNTIHKIVDLCFCSD